MRLKFTIGGKCFAAAMAAALFCATMGITVYATEDTETTTSGGTTDKTAKTADLTVNYHKDSEYTVKIPKTVTLDAKADGTGMEKEYVIKVFGSIASNEKVTVSPQDKDATTDGIQFDMIDQGDTAVKVAATVTQDTKEWTSATLKAADGDDAAITGKITSATLRTGIWQGTLTFDISLSNT